MCRLAAPLLICAVLLAAAAGCGRGDGSQPTVPQLGQGAGERGAAQALGFPGFATKNTTRVGGADAVADAAGVARAVFPATTVANRPRAVTLVDSHDWHGALAAAVLMAPPVRAPLLLSDGTSLPAASADALAALKPLGSDAAGGGQVIRIGNVARPAGLKSTDVRAGDAFATASAIDRLATAIRGTPSTDVIVAGAAMPSFAMPAAAWAAKSGDSLLFTNRDAVPAATVEALKRHQNPRIYVLGPESSVGPAALKALDRYGRVTRVSAPDPVGNAIAFSRFRDGSFGWGVVDPGHGLVFASTRQPLAAAAAAPLSASGTYGPLLLVAQPNALPTALGGYLLDIQPGYTGDPVRGVYNHGWLIGDANAISIATQAQMDGLLEITPVDHTQSP